MISGEFVSYLMGFTTMYKYIDLVYYSCDYTAVISTMKKVNSNLNVLVYSTFVNPFANVLEVIDVTSKKQNKRVNIRLVEINRNENNSFKHDIKLFIHTCLSVFPFNLLRVGLYKTQYFARHGGINVFQNYIQLLDWQQGMSGATPIDIIDYRDIIDKVNYNYFTCFTKPIHLYTKEDLTDIITNEKFSFDYPCKNVFTLIELPQQIIHTSIIVEE